MSLRKPFDTHIGIAAPFLENNIDTDQIIPSREMKTVGRSGLGAGLFAGQRYEASGNRVPKEDFVLNKEEYKCATIILAGVNFGCGSSREHAVWALLEFGIKCIIAESFGEIFYGNCIRNGLLAVTLNKTSITEINQVISVDPQNHKLEVDLYKQCVRLLRSHDDHAFNFEIGSYEKDLLLSGLDPIGLTLSRQEEINRFLQSDALLRPWVYQ